MRSKLTSLAVIASMGLGAFAANAATAVTGDLKVLPTVRQCTDNLLQQSGGCATGVALTIYLPLGAEVKSIRYYSTAGGPNGDVPIRQVTPGDFAWSYMDAATVTHTPSNVVVSTVYRNRSHNRERMARMEVEWSLPGALLSSWTGKDISTLQVK